MTPVIAKRTAPLAALAIALAVGLAAVSALNAQPAPAVKRNIVLKQEMTIPGREAVLAIVDLPAGSAEGKHTHPAEVFAFVVEGTVVLEVEGRPNATLKPGDHFYLAPGSVHQVVNSSAAPAKLNAVFVAEKGKPLTTPVP